MRRVRAALGGAVSRALPGRRSEAAPVFATGVQVNSLGLTEQQPENNAWRIMIRGARRRAVARCAVPGAPAADLERGDVVATAVGPAVVAALAADPRVRDRTCSSTPICSPARRSVAAKVDALCKAARVEARADRRAGAVSRARSTAVTASRSWSARWRRGWRGSSAGEQIVVGVNKWTDALPSPLVGGEDGGGVPCRSGRGRTKRSPRSPGRRATRDAGARRRGARRSRSQGAPPGQPVDGSLDRVCARSRDDGRMGRPRCGTVVGRVSRARPASVARSSRAVTAGRSCAPRVAALPRRPKLLVGKPGLDGHKQRRPR